MNFTKTPKMVHISQNCKKTPLLTQISSKSKFWGKFWPAFGCQSDPWMEQKGIKKATLLRLAARRDILRAPRCSKDRFFIIVCGFLVYLCDVFGRKAQGTKNKEHATKRQRNKETKKQSSYSLLWPLFEPIHKYYTKWVQNIDF